MGGKVARMDVTDRAAVEKPRPELSLHGEDVLANAFPKGV